MWIFFHAMPLNKIRIQTYLTLLSTHTVSFSLFSFLFFLKHLFKCKPSHISSEDESSLELKLQQSIFNASSPHASAWAHIKFKWINFKEAFHLKGKTMMIIFLNYFSLGWIIFIDEFFPLLYRLNWKFIYIWLCHTRSRDDLNFYWVILFLFPLTF